MATRTATPYARPRFARTRENAVAYAYILPGFVFISLATIVGTVYSLYISFTNYDGLTHFDTFDWVGLENYREVLFGVDLGTFWMVLQWTLVFALLCTLLRFAVGLALALLLNDQRLPERSVYVASRAGLAATPHLLDVLLRRRATPAAPRLRGLGLCR